MENSTTPQDSAAMPPASDGSVFAEPDAWAVFCSGERLGVYNTERAANEVAYCSGSRAYAVPLYRQPQPALADAERTEIRRLIEDYEQDGEPASQRCVDTLRGLLERTK